MWEIDLLKITIFWFLGAIVASGRAIGKAIDYRYFTNLLKDNLKLILVIQFVVNLYSFSFWVEVVIIFIITLISMSLPVLERYEKFQNDNGNLLKKILETTLGLIGLVALYHSLKMGFIDRENIVVLEKLKEFLLPIFLSTFFVFYIYLLVLYESYLQLFFRVRFLKINKKYMFLLRLRIFLVCRFNIIRVNNFIKHSMIKSSNISSYNDIKILMKDYKTNSKNK